MAKTIAQMTAEIEKLQRQIEATKSKEVQGVVDRIREAIDFYGLTSDQLFGQKSRKNKVAKAAKATRRAPAKAAAPRTPTKLPAKYSDGAGNEWTGRGSTPRWLQQAIAEGKSKDDFAIKP